MSAVRTAVKVYFSDDERDLLDRVAGRDGISRGQLIRDLALHAAITTSTPAAVPVRLRAVPANPAAPSLALYTAAVDSAARVAAGVPRPHLEAVVAAVFNTLMKPSADQSAVASERIAS